MNLNQAYLITTEATPNGKLLFFLLYSFKEDKRLRIKGVPFLFSNLLKLNLSQTIFRKAKFLFDELDYAWAFIAPYFYKKLKFANCDMDEFKIIEEQYFSGEHPEHDKKFITLTVHNKVIAVYLLIHKQKIELNCLKTLTGFEPKTSSNAYVKIEKGIFDIEQSMIVYNKINKKLAANKYTMVFAYGNSANYGLTTQVDKEITKKVQRKLKNGRIDYIQKKITHKIRLCNITIEKDFKYKIGYYTQDKKVYKEAKAEGSTRKIQNAWIHPRAYKFFISKSDNIKIEVIKIEHWKFENIESFFGLSNISFSASSMQAFKKDFGYENFKKHFGDKKAPFLNYETFDIVNRTRQGGFTGFNPNHINLSNITGHAIDVNGSYASTMLKNLPYGKPIYKKPKGKYASILMLEIKWFKIKPKWIKKIAPIFPVEKVQYRNSMTFLDPKKQYLYEFFSQKDPFTACFWEKEWAYIIKYYDIEFKIIDQIYFPKTKHTKSFVSTLNKVREETKTIQNKKVKLLTNGLFGKFFQKPWYTKKYFINLDNEPKKNMEFINQLKNTYCFTTATKTKIYALSRWKHETLVKIIGDNKFINKYDWIKPVDEEKRILQFIGFRFLTPDQLVYGVVGSYIAMDGRIKMYNTIEIIGIRQIAYWDTDSIYLIKEEISNKIDLNQVKIGAWKSVGKFSAIDILAIKTFRVLWTSRNIEKELIELPEQAYTYVVAGLPNAGEVFENVGHNQFKAGNVINGVNRIKVNIEDGKMILDTKLVLPGGKYGAI